MKRKDDTTQQETAVTSQMLTLLTFRSECPSTDTWLLFVSDLLPAAAAQKLEEHLGLCRFCQDEVSALTAVSEPQNPPVMIQKLADWIAAMQAAGYQLHRAVLQAGSAGPRLALRGNDAKTSRYEIGEYQLLIGKTAALGQTAVWQISGQLWHASAPTTDYSGDLLCFAQNELRQSVAIDELGTFLIGEMESGQYTLVFKLKSDLLTIDSFTIP